MDYELKWKAERERAAFLALADGTVFRGVAFGARGDRLGEAVFNTGMTGYQEIATDPSYAGQIVVLTSAEIGNYGVNAEDAESRGLFLSGLVVNDLATPSNFRSEQALDDYLAARGVPGLYGIDTRRLAIHIRDHGCQKAYLHTSPEPLDPAEAVRRAQAWEGLDGQDYAAKVTCQAPYDYPHAEFAKSAKFESPAGPAENAESFGRARSPSAPPTPAEPASNGGNAALERAQRAPVTPPPATSNSATGDRRPLVAVYDFGVKANILRSLAAFARVRVFPAKTPAEEILALDPDGVFLSNGPADPAALPYAIENIRKILGIAACDEALVARHPSLAAPVPGGHRPAVMGICLGHQLLALACGAKTARLKFGHHGCNHPVKELATGKVQITSQNHNFAVVGDALGDRALPNCLDGGALGDRALPNCLNGGALGDRALPDCLEVTHVNLNDGTIEGIRHKTLPAFSVQYHPEACPGPHDAAPLFAAFKEAIHA